jgi:16S rRNA (adenine1518-N6/adenine1519-N6)-dimethyltransferase
LGQNFLKSELALKKIVEAGEINSSDVILEIGPGKGALTEKLLEKAGKVIAVEKDRELFELLQSKFSSQISSGSLVLVHDDILEFKVESYRIENYKVETYKVIANIPYNITGAILKKFLTAEHQPERMILMVQHEVAKRIVARPAGGQARTGKESILSISVKAYGEPKMVMKVPARYFSPAPKVDSAVISINNISRKLFNNNVKSVQGSTLHRTTLHRMEEGLKLGETVDEERFWELVKTGFAHKRKKLSGNLKGFFASKKEFLGHFGNKRAEDLTLADWISLSRE